MRTRDGLFEEIAKFITKEEANDYGLLIAEILLDIRDLLSDIRYKK
jgi:hypothetical protein